MLQENRKYDLKNSFAYSYHNGCTAKKYTLVNSALAHEGCECVLPLTSLVLQTN